MNSDPWAAVDDYLGPRVAPHDAALEAALTASRDAGLPEIAVSACQGKFLAVLARSVRARAILEIGTLGGYSTIWLARALAAGGRLVTLEAEPLHAQVASANLARAGLADRTEVRLGRALDTLPKLAEEGVGPFDLVFIDADKPSIPEYFDWGVRLARPGALVVVDNVVRRGRLADADTTDEAVRGCRRLVEALQTDARVEASVVQTVGAKGYDGFAIASVL